MLLNKTDSRALLALVYNASKINETIYTQYNMQKKNEYTMMLIERCQYIMISCKMQIVI